MQLTKKICITVLFSFAVGILHNLQMYLVGVRNALAIGIYSQSSRPLSSHKKDDLCPRKPNGTIKSMRLGGTQDVGHIGGVYVYFTLTLNYY